MFYRDLAYLRLFLKSTITGTVSNVKVCVCILVYLSKSYEVPL